MLLDKAALIRRRPKRRRAAELQGVDASLDQSSKVYRTFAAKLILAMIEMLTVESGLVNISANLAVGVARCKVDQEPFSRLLSVAYCLCYLSAARIFLLTSGPARHIYATS